jgi:predicted dehydrogenase
LSIDYAAQKLEVWRLVARDGGGPPSIEGGDVPVPNEEPLVRELTDFVDAVRTPRPPIVTGEQGRQALDLAQRIADQMAGAGSRGSNTPLSTKPEARSR